MKTDKVIYWVTTIALALFILPGIFYINSVMAIEGIRHLGLPEWFRYETSIGTFIGGLLLILPVGKRLKEWTYVALGIVYISAFIAHIAIDGFGSEAIMALVAFVVLVISYIYYHKLHRSLK